MNSFETLVNEVDDGTNFLLYRVNVKTKGHGNLNGRPEANVADFEATSYTYKLSERASNLSKQERSESESDLIRHENLARTFL